jgi:phosphoribosylformimino-5-aminoimidazole carboxamide ribotide isomerase
MRLIPVLDILSGRAVHAVGGDRAHYRPVQSILHDGSDPIAIAGAFRDVLGLRELYLADLDAIAGSPPAFDLYRLLAGLGLSTWVDAGLRSAEFVPALLDANVATIVAGLETLRGPDDLAEIVERAGPSRALFSLDLRDGAPLGDWGTGDPVEVARLAVNAGVRRILVLDLARVGTHRGLQTGAIFDAVRRQYPHVELAVGGGVRGVEDLQRLAERGIASVLVASAIHQGRIGGEECRKIVGETGETG